MYFITDICQATIDIKGFLNNQQIKTNQDKILCGLLPSNQVNRQRILALYKFKDEQKRKKLIFITEKKEYLFLP